MEIAREQIKLYLEYGDHNINCGNRLTSKERDMMIYWIESFLEASEIMPNISPAINHLYANAFDVIENIMDLSPNTLRADIEEFISVELSPSGGGDIS